MKFGGDGTKLYSTANTSFKKVCLQNKLQLLDASVRHLGTDINYVVLENLYNELSKNVEINFNEAVVDIKIEDGIYHVITDKKDYVSKKCIVSAGRSGSKWISELCNNLKIETNSNRVDIGVRVEIPAAVFSHITDKVMRRKTPKEELKNPHVVVTKSKDSCRPSNLHV